MSSRWYECQTCFEEFQVIGGSLDQVPEYCAFCGEPLPVDEEELEEEEE